MIKVQEKLYIILSTCFIVHMVHIFETLIAFFYAHPLSLSLFPHVLTFYFIKIRLILISIKIIFLK